MANSLMQSTGSPAAPTCVPVSLAPFAIDWAVVDGVETPLNSVLDSQVDPDLNPAG